VGNPAAGLFGYLLSRAVAKLLGRTLIFACLALDKIQASGVSRITGSRDSAAGFLPNLAAADGLAWQMCNWDFVSLAHQLSAEFIWVA